MNLGVGAKGRWSLIWILYGTYLLAGNPFEQDALTGKSSRYESGLVAVDAPERKALWMPSIAELVYQKNKMRLGLGNFALESTFLNMEHGRMIPSTYSGMNVSNRWDQFKLEGAWIAMVGARSTSGFKSVAQSLAQYNPGLDTAGSRHDKTEVEAPWGLIYGATEQAHNLAQWYGVFVSKPLSSQMSSQLWPSTSGWRTMSTSGTSNTCIKAGWPMAAMTIQTWLIFNKSGPITSGSSPPTR